MTEVSARKYLISNAKTNFIRVGVSALASSAFEQAAVYEECV